MNSLDQILDGMIKAAKLAQGVCNQHNPQTLDYMVETSRWTAREKKLAEIEESLRLLRAGLR